MIWDVDKEKVVDCTTPMTYEEYKRMTNQYCRNVAHKPMTNEEWIKSLDTEGLVDYLYEVHKGGDSVERQRWIERHKERVKMQFRGWLKQPHSEVADDKTM